MWRVADNIRNADGAAAGATSGSASAVDPSGSAGAVETLLGSGSAPGGPGAGKGKEVSFDLRGNTTSLIRA